MSATQPTYDYIYTGTDVLETLPAQQQQIESYLSLLTENQAGMAYAAGKWTVKELLGHLIDSERVFAYRALSIARGEKQPLPGFDENSYVHHAHFNKYPLNRLLVQYHAQRNATIHLIASFDQEMLSRSGIANGKSITVKQITEKIAAHEQHHISILEERYLTMWR